VSAPARVAGANNDSGARGDASGGNINRCLLNILVALPPLLGAAAYLTAFHKAAARAATTLQIIIVVIIIFFIFIIVIVIFVILVIVFIALNTCMFNIL
jgi:hypothetical protein